MCIRDRTKAVNAELIDRHLEFINLHWEDGRAACAPALDGFSWHLLDRKQDSGPGEPACAGVEPVRSSNHAETRI
eukprot:4413818-Alexandrium_andersonii.AAC.1